jgi:hypothetical protein
MYRWERRTAPFGLRPGQEVDTWRLDIGLLYWRQLAPQYASETDPTWKDWCGSYIDLDRATSDSSDFGRLWLDDVHLTDVRREWLQSAVRWTQTQMKISASNPVDEQHTAYLIDADIFLSADRNLVRALEEVHDQAPFAFAEPRFIERDASGSFVETIIAALE